ncbi:putative DNA binding domain-containing protein [Burkholderia cepacia]|uniref:ATP-binding protein n=1 Tax=Burkholderia cepacia TaxID=292 RepID=UPI00186786A0|nr:ATP-binding protein [Burkholderia cepacia]MBE2969419.1 putative DNA binding domain-containing protein [Burkholderia cepacia]
MDALILKDRILKTIELRESQFREFKSGLHGEPGSKRARELSSVSKDISETLVAFANADGGELLVGVEDDGSVTGLQYSEQQLNVLLKAPLTGVHPDTPLASPHCSKVELDSKVVLYFSVEKSTRGIHQTSDGRCLQRRDLESVPVSASKLQFERQEQQSRQYDREFVDGAHVTDLDLDLVNAVSENTSRMSPERCLQYLGLAEYGLGILRLRRAALLLFAKDIEKWHPRCQVRVVRVRGVELGTGRDYNVSSDETVTGNVLQLLTKAWDQLRPHLVGTKLTDEALFRERVMYPEDACREALINAITHRDYSIEGKNIEILVFDDRIEILSPGALLSTIHVDDLKKQQGIHESRNVNVARGLREIGYVREMGEGMRRIFRLMKDADLVSPELKSNTGNFSIALFHKSVFSSVDQAWLSGYLPLKLSREEMLVMLTGKAGQLMSPQQIYDLLELHDWDLYRVLFEQLAVKGLIVNDFSENQKNKAAKRLGLGRRDVPRLRIRQPNEVESMLAELFVAIRHVTPVGVVDSKSLHEILGNLPENSAYKSTTKRMKELLLHLGLIDQDSKPSVALAKLWQATSVPRDGASGAFHEGSTVFVKAPTDARQGGVEAINAGNLNYAATGSEVRKLFEKYGPVISIDMQVDYVTGKNRGFALVKMSSREDAARAIRELNSVEFMGRNLRLSWKR